MKNRPDPVGVGSWMLIIMMTFALAFIIRCAQRGITLTGYPKKGIEVKCDMECKDPS